MNRIEVKRKRYAGVTSCHRRLGCCQHTCHDSGDQRVQLVDSGIGQLQSAREDKEKKSKDIKGLNGGYNTVKNPHEGCRK
jgi:hypothetical protein